MAWYRTGSVAVTNGSATVTGTGTAWVDAIRAGWAFNGPDGQVYEIAAVVSATQITLASVYQGGTQSGAAYSIIPTQGLEQALAASLSSLLSNYQDVYDGAGQGKFPDGSVAAPGLRFAADEDTGLYRPASNQLAAAAGGVLRWLLSSTAFQVDVPITGTAVQSSSTDTTAGRVMKVKAFGVGGLAGGALTNPAALNTFNLPAGLYQTYQANDPIGGNFNNYLLAIPAGFDSGSRGIGYLSWSKTSGADPRVYIGSMNGTETAVTWTKLVSLKNILGTVGQSGGVPTGAIIERGSNANGDYVRFADGTQICTQTYVVSSPVWVASGAGYRLDTAPVLQWAASFAAVPVVSGNVKEYAHLHGGAYQNSSNYCSINTLSMTQAVGPLTFNMMAIGRWF